MEALKISDLRLITCGHQSIKPGLHQFTDAAAQYALLTKQISLRFFFERRLNHTGPGSPDSLCVSQRQIKTVSGGVLPHSKYIGNPGACQPDPTHQVTRSFGSYHKYIYIGRRLDLLKMNVKTMGKGQSAARF